MIGAQHIQVSIILCQRSSTGVHGAPCRMNQNMRGVHQYERVHKLHHKLVTLKRYFYKNFLLTKMNQPTNDLQDLNPDFAHSKVWCVSIRLDQWFSNFFWSRTICGSRTVITYHLVPGKVNVPNIIRSKVWKTRIDTNATWTKWLWEILMAIFRKQQGK